MSPSAFSVIHRDVSERFDDWKRMRTTFIRTTISPRLRLSSHRTVQRAPNLTVIRHRWPWPRPWSRPWPQQRWYLGLERARLAMLIIDTRKLNHNSQLHIYWFPRCTCILTTYRYVPVEKSCGNVDFKNPWMPPSSTLCHGFSYSWRRVTVRSSSKLPEYPSGDITGESRSVTRHCGVRDCCSEWPSSCFWWIAHPTTANDIFQKEFQFCG